MIFLFFKKKKISDFQVPILTTTIIQVDGIF